MNPSVLSFFTELFQRFRTKSPVFFKIIQAFSGALTFASYIPSMMQRWFNVEVPGHYITLCEDLARYATGFFAASLLPVASNPVALMGDGDILKKTDEKKLPFTSQCENKIDREKLQNVEKVPEVVEIKADEASHAKEEDKK